MSSGLQISPFISMLIGALFTFSTLYGMMFYFYQGETQQLELTQLGDNVNDVNELNTNGSFISSFVSGAFDTFLSFISWFSPVFFIRGIIQQITPNDLFLVLDIFFLRPFSWAVSILTANAIISAVRGKSEG